MSNTLTPTPEEIAAQIGEQIANEFFWHGLRGSNIEKLRQKLIAQAIREAEDRGTTLEREACIKIAREAYAEPGWCGDYKTAAANIAEIIRERGEMENKQ